MLFKIPLGWREMPRKTKMYHILILFLKPAFVYPEYPRALVKLVLDVLKIRILSLVMSCCVVW
jgi:hypothetical protein